MEDKENEHTGSSSNKRQFTPEQRQRKNEQLRRKRAVQTSEEKQSNLEKRRKNEPRVVLADICNQYPNNSLMYRRKRDPPSQYAARNPTIRPPLLTIGNMDVACTHCNAMHFKGEMTTRKTFGVCCSSGSVQLQPLNPYPDQLRNWLIDQSEDGKNFRENLRKYNSSFAFASFGYQPVKLERGPPVFVIHGQVYHRMSTSVQGTNPVYSQLYILDPEYATQERMANEYNASCKQNIMEEISRILQEANPFVGAFKMMQEVINDNKESLSTINMWITKDRQHDPRRYNLPVANEVAAVFLSEDGEPPFKRDIAIHSRNDDNLQQINIISPNCDPMIYPILFPFGEPGWQPGIIKDYNSNVRGTMPVHADADDDQEQKSRNVSMLEFYSYRLQKRNAFNPLLHAGKLTQQFIVDAFLKVEGQRLEWNRLNQKKLRVDLYLGLMDYVNNRAEQMDLRAGRLIILPSSFPGGARSYQQNYQDAMVMVAKFGKPDLFITFTCNPKWKEITDNLGPNENTVDRPDLVATVFYLKLKELINDLVCDQGGVLGKVKSYISVIEFQKRGLPHCHMLLHLAEQDKFREPSDVDNAVCAEIPKEDDEELLDIVKTCMIHGPCGDLNRNSPCMTEENGVWICSKGFPKTFTDETNMNVNGYPLYKRRNDGRKILIRGFDADNRYVVPYNPYLSKKYNAHINVEICSSVKSVKYIFKYVYKGHDAAVVQVNSADTQGTLQWDEIRHFLDTRYISAPEAMWRLRKYEMFNRSHAIERLQVHLPNLQPVVFEDGTEEDSLQRSLMKGTKLTKWFELNRNDPVARQYLYSDIPHHYVWRNNTWHKRKRGGNKILSRMYSVSPKDMERYCLKLMLLHVKGAMSFEALRTVDGVTHETFKQAAVALNLLPDDSEWLKCMEEASVFRMPAELRQLFCAILSHGNPVNPLNLYSTFKDSMMEDYIRNHSEYMAEQLALKDIEETLLQFGKSCLDFCLPVPVDAYNDIQVNFEKEKLEYERLRTMMNAEQGNAYDIILDAVARKRPGKCFFLSGAGGSGKTFVYKALSLKIIAEGGLVKAVAPTGLAATLLTGGKTVHSGFGIPIDVDKRTVSRFKQGSKEWEQLRNTKLIIWDEISMCHVVLLEAVDRSLRDLLNSSEPFGGIVFVVGGDFRQQAPVVVHGNRVKIVEACVKSSKLWNSFQVLKLKRNMRVNQNEVEFSNWLLSIGSGKSGGAESDFAKIDEELLSSDIIQSTFGDNLNELSIEELAARAILCPKNEDTLRINEAILEKLEGETRTYYSVDSVAECENEEESAQYPIEFLNSLTPMGMPLHALNLKTGCCVMLLRNINPKRGLCNGTRVIVEHAGSQILECSVFSGEYKGNKVFIPRINLDANNSDLPFHLKRKQFPVRLAYSMTITKSQGQTFDRIGVLLPEPVFTHGQLYTAFSRVRSKNGLRVQIKKGSRQGMIFENDNGCYTYNCVYKEIL